MKKKKSFNIIPPGYFKETKHVLKENSRIEQKAQVSLKHPEAAHTVDDNQLPIKIDKELPDNPNNDALQKKGLPSISLNKNQHRNSGLSLSSIKKKKEHLIKQMDVVHSEEELPKEKFTEDEMRASWETFANKLEKDGKFNLASILRIDVPTLKDTTIHLEFPNATNKIEVERQQYDLLSFLRKQLNNYDIVLDIKVNEEKEKLFAYTPEEKYDKLKEKNPKIELLKKLFELDV